MTDTTEPRRYHPELDMLAAALAKAQGEIDPAPKDADNPYFKSKYASLPAVREAVRHAFAAHGLSVVQMPEVVTGPDQVAVLKLRTVLLHDSGQRLDCGTLCAEVDSLNPQKMGSAITYFRRYALAAVAQCVADEDDDANAASQKPPALTKTELTYITDAKAEIAQASSLEELAAIGNILKEKSRGVQNALRGDYGKRQSALKAQEAE